MGQHAFAGTFSMTAAADYHALMGFIDTSIIADGWTHVAQTGDSDPGSVAQPAQNASTVWRVYKSPAGTGLTDLYARITYERNASDQPQFVVQMGTTVDGSGNLGGITTTSRTITPSTATNPGHAYVSGALGYLTVALDILQTNGNGCYFFVDRSVDGTETVTNTYWTQVTYSNGSGHPVETKMLDGSTQPPVQNSVPAVIPYPVTGGGTWIIGSHLTAPFMLPIIEAGNAQHSPNIATHTTNAVDFAVDTQTIISTYGTNHTYIVCGQPTTGLSGNRRCLLRYD